MMRTMQKGFTVLELLLVVAGITILAGLVIVAINPLSQLQTTRNAQRDVDVHVILNAVHHYAADNSGSFPSTIPIESDCLSASGNEICRTGASSCSGFISLSALTDDERYLVEIPVDPSASSASDGTGYQVSRSSTGRITVCAPLAENSEMIQVKR